MRKYRIFFFVSLIFLSAEAEEINAFTTPGAYVHNGAALNQTLRFSADGPDHRPATRLTWDSGKKNYAEINLRKPPVYETLSRLEVELEYYSDGSGQWNTAGIRMLDAGNECFQWIVPAHDNTPGWKKIRATLAPDNYTDSWGKRKNGKIDFPVRLIGFAVGFSHGTAGPVWLGRMNCRVPEERPKISAQTHRWNFDDYAERWNSWGAARMTKKRITVGKPGNVFFNERMFPLRPIAEPDKIRLHYTLESGNAEAFLTLFDGTGKQHTLPVRRFESERGTLTWELKPLTPPLKLSLLRIRTLSDGCRLHLHTLEAWERKAPEASVEVSLDTGHPLHLLLPGKPQVVTLQLENRTQESLQIHAEFEIDDFFGKVDSFSRTLEFAPRQSRTVSLPVDRYPRDGIFFIHYTFRAPGSSEQFRGQRCFARMIPAGPAPETERGDRRFMFGICTHTERWGLRDRELEALAAALAGAGIVRDSVGWGEIQPGNNVWKYTMFDELVSLYGKYGIELQGGFGLCTRWGKAPDAKLRSGKPDPLNNGRSMPELNAWTRYVRKTVARYKDRIRYWEVWNEPDLAHFANFGVEDYLRLQDASFRAIREASPSAQVMNGGFAGLGNEDQIRYQQTFLEQGKGSFDIHAFHQHGDFRYYRRIIDDVFLPMRRKTGTDSIPWYANETAMHSLGGQDRAQAETLFKKLIFSWARGAMGYTWYDLRNDGFSVTDAEHNYGMMTNDFHPKAVYPVYAALVRLYGKMEFLRELTPAQGEYMYLFRKKNEQELAAASWREPVEAAFSGTLFAGVTDADSLEIADLMGNRRPHVLHSGRFLYQSGRIPETLLLHGATALSFLPVLRAEASGPAAEGHTVRIRADLKNPFDTALSMKLRLNAPEGFCPLSGTERHLTAEPDGQISAVFDFRIGKTEENGFRPYRLGISATTDDGAAAELGLPVYPAKCLSAKPDKRHPDFLLNNRSQVVSLYDKVPGRSIWQGPQDLSAKIFCGLSGKAFRITAVVQDDVHFPQGRGPQLWKGDSIQFFLELPGRGTWVAGGALNEAGKPEKWVWNAPSGCSAEKACSALDFQAERSGEITTYTIQIPRREFGLTDSLLKDGFRFNLLVNDSDTHRDGREGWIRIAPGAGDEVAPLQYPVVFFADGIPRKTAHIQKKDSTSRIFPGSGTAAEK